jgi:GMP synthase PP-ATPase subunit
MNPETVELEELAEVSKETQEKLGRKMQEADDILREELKKKDARRSQWELFSVGEIFTLKGYPFRVTKIKESGIVLKAVPPDEH